MSDHVHRYSARVEWEGSTAVGYDDYVRDHQGEAPPAAQAIEMSGDPAFRGDAGRMNPEQMLVLAASSCQLLSFIAVAARARIDVRSYEDDAEGTMDEEDKPAHIGRIVLRPRIVLTAGPTAERVRELCDVAHRHCYIANSLKTEVLVEPEIEFADG